MQENNEIKSTDTLANELKENLIDKNPLNLAIVDYKPKALADLMAEKFDPVQWLVEGLVPASGIIAISGSPASFKTWFMLDMAQKIASGTMLFDRFGTKQTGVLIIDEENGDRLLQSRFKAIGNRFDLPIHTLSYEGFKLTPDSVKKLVKTAKDKNVGLIMFDSLVRIHESEENNAKEMAYVLGLLRRITTENLTVVFTHHNRKKGSIVSGGAQEMRGSSDILASLDSHISIDREQDESHITVSHNKSRYAKEIGKFSLLLQENDKSINFEFGGEIGKTKSKKKETEELITGILANTEEKLCKNDVFDLAKKEGLDVGMSTFKSVINSMITRKLINEERGERNKVYCLLNKPAENA